MVQLKSFKQLEDSEEGEVPASSPGEQQTNSRSSSKSTSSSSSSSVSAASIISGGGNLTGLNEESSLKQAINNEDKSTTTTLSSNEEYQIAKHDIITEEEEEEEGQEKNKAQLNQEEEEEDALTTKITLEAQQQQQDQSPRSPTFNQQPNQINFLVNNNKQIRLPPPASSSPQLNSRSHHHHIRHQQPKAPNSPKILIHNSSGVGVSSKALKNPDSISQYSFVQRQQQAQSNQFEIRWHDVNLYANKSRLPRFISENSVYKYFTAHRESRNNNNLNQQQQQQLHFNSEAETSCYSPVMNNKFARINVKRTIEQATEKAIGSELPADWLADSTRPILTNLSGAVVSGQLTAILGPSGVGKTTLLNSLTGRNNLDGTGRVLLFGAGLSKRLSVVTVPQEDVLPKKLTVLEDLKFTSRIKNPIKGFDHDKNINRIVQHLQLEKFLHNRIEKLSGGEARRLSIGRELLSSPDIMILDEPTSGLDANTCKKIITALRDIVVHSDNILDRPMAIIVTIHQPQQEVLNLFHRLYVMAIGGRAIYEGPPASLLPTLLEHSSLNQICPCDQLNENPAIVAIEVASGEYGPDVIGELAAHHESQMFEDYNYSLAGGSSSDNLDNLANYQSTPKFQLKGSGLMGTPKSLPRSPRMSVTPRIGHRRRLKSLSAQSPSLGRRTPILPAKTAKQFISSAGGGGDHLSSVTSLSYASSYDEELPELTSHLKVDKRLRRSVVMKGDFFRHTLVLMHRCWLMTTRDLFLMAIRILGFLLVAGGMVQIFHHALDPEENQCPMFRSEVDDIRSYLEDSKARLFNMPQQFKQASSTHLFFFHLVLCTTMVTSALAGLVFPLQMRMFIREYKNGWYSPASFITSLTISELPIDLIGPTLTMLITYPLCNQPTSAYYWRELAYIGLMIISSIITKSQAQIVGAFLMDSVENSVFISCVMVTPPALLSGIAVRVSAMSWPLQLVSYGSFLRYTFECLFVVRYGYGICPCDSESVTGYPVRTSAEAVPAQLDRLSRGLLELNLPSTTTTMMPATMMMNDTSSNISQSLATTTAAGDNNNDNLFLRFVQLVSASSNQFVKVPEDLGDCSKYRSLYLIDMGIEDRILFKWVSVLLAMFLISRIITYFVVKTVIKLRKGRD